MELAFDPGSFAIGGISLMAFVFGAVQLIKDWTGWEGKKVTGLSAIMGLLVMVLYQAIQFLPPEIVQYVEAIFISLAFGLATSGFYKFTTRNDR
jgi:hypothetical protein